MFRSTAAPHPAELPGRDQRDWPLVAEPGELRGRERRVRGAPRARAELQVRDVRPVERRTVARLHEHARGLRSHLADDHEGAANALPQQREA